ncbi:hypothetical protein SAMN05421504_10412 [Amycolatopsis xylanica]|uniref:Secreted protein n=1 Tax=Amycolatopsis xylanica TaxID=589385 RepID=A0A1H3FWY1_9PSEU|nr:hypothetical protein [Amycolatopsis xylanica]SDX94878.1 hypothetical protein SAMN05421504_10412 [Amycolatopsis xylanica]
MRIRRLAALALAVVSLPLTATGVAHADTAEALAACRRSAASDFSDINVIVQGNGGGSVPRGADPGNVLRTGDVFLLLPSFYAKVKIDSWLWGPSYGENGNGVRAANDFPYPGLSQYSAVLRFNNNPTGWVGAPAQATAFAQCTVWGGPRVRLLFGVNDSKLSDNSGYWWFSYYQYMHDRTHR